MLVVMCDTYRYIEISIFSFNIVIQYWLLGVSIYWNGQFSKPGFPHLSNFIPKSNNNKLVCITLIDSFYHFLTSTTKQDIYLHFMSISIIISNIMILAVSYRDIFCSDTQYNVQNVLLFIVVSHIPTC